MTGCAGWFGRSSGPRNYEAEMAASQGETSYSTLIVLPITTSTKYLPNTSRGVSFLDNTTFSESGLSKLVAANPASSNMRVNLTEIKDELPERTHHRARLECAPHQTRKRVPLYEISSWQPRRAKIGGL